MLTQIDAIFLLLTVCAACAAWIRYWQVVDEDLRDDCLPDPVLSVLLQGQREPRGSMATAAAPDRPGQRLLA